MSNVLYFLADLALEPKNQELFEDNPNAGRQRGYLIQIR